MDYIKPVLMTWYNTIRPILMRKSTLNNLIMKTCRLSYTVCNEFIGWDFIRESTNSQAFLKNLSNELEELLMALLYPAARHPQTRNLPAAPALPNQMQ
jgi:hypothetical protein